MNVKMDTPNYITEVQNMGEIHTENSKGVNF